jgi:hypothetical protein
MDRSRDLSVGRSCFLPSVSTVARLLCAGDKVERRLIATSDDGVESASSNTLAHSVALKDKVSKAWVRRVKQRHRESGELEVRRPIKKTPSSGTRTKID